MIRRPTPIDDLYRWHRDSLAGLRPPVTADDPQCGWFKLRFVRGGPWVPVVIYCEQHTDPETGDLTEPEKMICILDRAPRDPHELWLRCAAHPVSEEEYLSLTWGNGHMTEIRQATHARVDLSQKPVRP